MVDCYIIRHGLAVEAGTAYYPNDDRPLTEEGRSRLKVAARGLVRIMKTPDAIITSPLSRARDTAMILAKAFGWTGSIEETSALLPESDVGDLLAELAACSGERVILVGHQPLLALLIAELCDLRSDNIEVKKASCTRCSVRSFRPGGATLKWHVPPKILETLGT